MNTFSGADLRAVFKNLGINTGNVSDLTIDSWFDTDCEDMKELLNWMCGSLTLENALTSSELNEYKQAVGNNSLLSGKQYEAELNQLKLNFPGISEYEVNVLESECMEDDLMILLEEEKHLERALNLQENVSKILLRELAEKQEEEACLSLERKAMEEKCTALSCQLDDVNKKVQQQICHYAENINEYDYSTNPLFLSSFPLSQYEQYYTDMESYINLLLKREARTGTNSTVKSARKKLIVLNHSDGSVDELEVLRDRIFQSTYTYFCKQIQKDVLHAQIRFLEEADRRLLSRDESLDMDIILKGELVSQMFIDLENVCRELCNTIIEKPKLSVMLTTIDLKQEKLNSLTKINDILTKILSSIILLHQLIDIEKSDTESAKQFFRDIHSYITNNVHNGELRIKSMNEIIQDYNVYQNLSLDEKLKFAGVIKTMLVDKTEDVSALDILNRFDNNYIRLEQQVFFDDSKVHNQYCKLLEQDLKIVRNFLASGPTSSIITFPQQIMNTFSNIFNIMDSQNIELLSTLQAISDAKNKLTKNKWLKMKRLLSMWFLLKPTKMLLAIQEIETEVTKQRNQTVLTTTTLI